MSERSDDLELVNVFASSNFDAESEADVVLALLESAGITANIVRQNVQELPAGLVEVKVPAEQEAEARAVIEAAKREGSQ